MSPRAEIDVREFNQAIRQLSAGSKKKAVELSNQIALDVSREWFNAMPPPIAQIAAKRREISAYMRQPLATKIKLATSGTRKGKFVQRGTRANALQRRHLILQARQRRAGKRGLYGDEMRRFAAAFSGRAARSVGYLKVMLLPVIRALNPVVKYKMPYSETGGSGKISIWPGSKGYGRAKLAFGANPLAILYLAWNFIGPQAGRAAGLVMAGWRQAADFKLGKLRRMIERELQPELDKVNAKRARP
jgi:hypothetical protein